MACFGCICLTCARDVNSATAKPGEVDEKCFNCEECWEYDHDWMKRKRKMDGCARYARTQHWVERDKIRARLRRRQFSIIHGQENEHGKD